MTAAEVRRLLALEPLEPEGGWFAEVYRSRTTLAPEQLPAGYGGPRSLATAIYYLLEARTISAMHRLRSDELFHFYLGDPVEMLRLVPGTPGDVVRLGADLAAGERPQALVPGGSWQGARLAPGGRFALLGTTVSPGFEPADFELGRRAPLVAAWPHHRERIEALTAPPA